MTMKRIRITEKELKKIIEQSLIFNEKGNITDCFEREGIKTPEACTEGDMVKCKLEVLNLLIGKKIHSEKAARIVDCIDKMQK